MASTTITFWLSIWGAVISAGLAGLRVYEFYKDRRPKLSITTILRGCEDHGNDIVLLNASKVPANIYIFDLVRAKRGFLGKNISIGRRLLDIEFSLEDNSSDITVPPHSQYNLNFNEMDHFPWGKGLKVDIYLRLWIVGHNKPLWLWVTGPKNAWPGRLRRWLRSVVSFRADSSILRAREPR